MLGAYGDTANKYELAFVDIDKIGEVLIDMGNGLHGAFLF